MILGVDFFYCRIVNSKKKKKEEKKWWLLFVDGYCLLMLYNNIIFFSKFHLTIEYKKVNTSTSLAVLTEDTLMAKTSQLVFAATHGR